jgi:tRNA(fMet)-specific endonuclease VapC
MPQYLLDTDHLSLFERNHPLVVQRVASSPQGTVGLSAVSIEEALRGRVATLNRRLTSTERVRAYDLLVNTHRILCRFDVVPFDQASEARFQMLQASGLRIGNKDLKIAAIALVNRLTLLTRNRRDFQQVPNLLLDDWTV